jgi:hypothetical protein
MPAKNTLELFIYKANNKHNYKYDYSLVKYINNKTKISIIYPIDNHGLFYQTPNSHLMGQGCVKCYIQLKPTYLKLSINSFKEKANKVHNFKYDYSESIYINSNTKIIIICNQDNHGRFLQIPASHLSGIGCPKCVGKYKPTTDEFKEKSKLIHGNKYDYSKTIYVNSNTKVIITCKEHGDFLQNPRTHIKGTNCPKCAIGNVSKAEKEWFDFLLIPEEYRQVIIKLINKKYLVDVYDPKTNTIYEYNGDFWHGNPKFYKSDRINKVTKTTFGELYQKTLEKEAVLKTAGYNVISIWESEWKEIQTKI